jgi:glycerol-3-phosphate dehydrogenase (NAD(P)+)
LARFAVIGATSWGVTLAWLLTRNGHAVSVITRGDAEAAAVRGRSGIARLPGIVLSGVEVISAADLASFDGVIVAVPAQHAQETVARFAWPGVHALSAAKGIEVATARRMSEILGAAGPASVTVLSGPNLSHEIAAGLPAAAVVATVSAAAASLWQRALSTREFRAYSSDDVVGVELAGALKNVIAIAAGAAWGLDFGANAVATLMTRGLAEITRLGVASGANPLTFQGLAGVGDLAATCYSPLSRNRRFGELLGRGATHAEASAAVGETVEGAATAAVAVLLASRSGVELPICAQVADVVAGRRSVATAMDALLNRPLRAE